MTALASAFEKAGISRAQIEAYPAAIRFHAMGGTRERWIALWDRVETRLSADLYALGLDKPMGYILPKKLLFCQKVVRWRGRHGRVGKT